MNWKTDYQILNFPQTTGIECTISILHNDVWISRRDAAELSAIEAIKGGYSDAMKRAAVNFGIGRFLYNLPKQYVEIHDNKPNGKWEKVGSKYKVNGNMTFVNGYYIRPSLQVILNHQNKPQNNSSNRRNGQEAPQHQSQAANRNQQSKQPHQTRQQPQPTSEEHIACIQQVEQALRDLNIQPNFVPKLFEIAGTNAYMSIQAAPFEALQRLYEMINPVKVFMGIGQQHFNLSSETLFSYASNVLGQQIKKISDLFNKLDSEKVNMAFEKIRYDIEINSKRNAR